MEPDPTTEETTEQQTAPNVEAPPEESFDQARERLVKEAQACLAEAQLVVKQLAGGFGEKYGRALNKLHEAIGALQ